MHIIARINPPYKTLAGKTKATLPIVVLAILNIT